MPPVIVLVRPQLGENIGKAARAMLNFGLTEMRLVAPRDGWPNPSAGPAAAGADMCWNARGVRNAGRGRGRLRPCLRHHGTQARRDQAGARRPRRPRGRSTEPGRSAYVFGPERSGLETDDVALARAIVTVPINPEFGSLNLAQAVILCAYEWSKHALEQPTEPTGYYSPRKPEELLPPAPQEDLEGDDRGSFGAAGADAIFP
jgi:tRNA/rRNA methyltransferase